MPKQKKEKTIQISISMPLRLLKQIDEMAENENRNRSNFICNVFCELAKQKKNQNKEKGETYAVGK
ncbi:MAG: type II toxin-antitoxin system HicB family antitoxin [Opitutales bacterium]|nr:type II toxin-antitoxin system HicB family antitoxin [Opitutales bacterium]MBP3358452.1 type II toxin-antitoxin system HicB family antitoxin [Opitutales bacterium]